jgi:hypothetical protein
VDALRGRGVGWISKRLKSVAVQGPPTPAEMQIFTDAARRVRGVRVCSQHVHKSYIHTHTRACTMAKCVCVSTYASPCASYFSTHTQGHGKVGDTCAPVQTTALDACAHMHSAVSLQASLIYTYTHTCLLHGKVRVCVNICKPLCLLFL